MSKTSASFRTDYVYAGNQVVSEFQNNVASANYTIGAGEVVKSDFAVEGARYYFSDALGSTTSLSDANSSLIARNEYDAFGVQSSSGNTGNAIGYTGQRLDYETGLMALGNGERYYSPSYARFIQQDSWLGNNAMPQSMNRFSYAYNNPFKYIDPSGNQGVFSNGTNWTGNETANWWIDFAGSLVQETNTPTREKLGQSLELWNSWALGVGDAFQTTGEGLGNFAGGILYGDAKKTLGDAWTGIKETASMFGEIATHPIEGFNVLSDAAMNDPHAFMRAIGKSSGEVVIAETGAKITSPITRPITSAVKRAVVGTSSRILTRVSETAAGRAVTRVATETVEKAGTRLSSTVERVGQRTTALKQSISETVGKAVDKFNADERGSLILREGKTPKSYPDVALGKKSAELLDFANSPKIKASSWYSWFEDGLALKPFNQFTDKFGSAFYRATYRARKIKFNLEDVGIDFARNMKKDLSRSVDPTHHPLLAGKVTEWELRQIMHNKRLWEKTEFYHGDNLQIDPKDLSSWGITRQF